MTNVETSTKKDLRQITVINMLASELNKKIRPFIVVTVDWENSK
jgi:hypothetical protein